MRKVLTIILLLTAICQASHAQMPEGWWVSRFRFGMEWGYSQCLWLDRDYNIISSGNSRLSWPVPIQPPSRATSKRSETG